MNSKTNGISLDEKSGMGDSMQPLIELHEVSVWKAFNASPIPMIIVSYPEGHIFDVNDSFAAFTGYSRQEIIGFTDLELGMWEQPAERQTIISSITVQRKVSNVEVRIRKRTDDIRTALFSGEQVTLSGKTYLLAWFVDISDLKQVQQELWKQKQEFKALAENSPDIIARMDKNLRYVYISPKAETVTGIPVIAFTGRTLQELGFASDTCNLWRMNICRVFEAREKTLFEGFYQGIQGREYYYQAHLAPEYAADGSVEYILCSIRNITTIKRAEQALRQSEEHKQRILEAFPDLLFLINKSGVFLDCQAGKEALLYTPPEQFLGKTVTEILPAEVADKIIHHIERAIGKNQIQVFDYQLMVNKSLLTFEARLVWAKDDEVLFIVRDITKLKQLESSLARLDRLNTVGEMAAGIAHELRNPMTTVRGFLQLLSNKPETSCFKEQFTLMIDELDRANSIITEYLSLAKNKVVQFESHNLAVIINSLAPLMRADAAIAGKSLAVMLGETSDLLVDPKEVRQLLLNLVRNGFDSMQPGTTLTIRTYQENDNVFLVVEDQGCGIEKEILEKIGTPFFTTKENGNGLGLAICYSIAARHDAIISIDTSPTGTLFFVRFKIKIKTYKSD